MQRQNEEGLLAAFGGVVVKAGNLWAVLDIGTREEELVRVDGVAWGSFRGSGIPVPPPKGTKVCVLVLFTPSSLRAGVFDEAKVFLGSACTARPVGQAERPW